VVPQSIDLNRERDQREQMAAFIEELEWGLITNNKEGIKDIANTDLQDISLIIADIIEQKPLIAITKLRDYLKNLKPIDENDSLLLRMKNEICILCIGISLLNAFVQLNFVGPPTLVGVEGNVIDNLNDLKELITLIEPKLLNDLGKFLVNDMIDEEKVLQELSVDGEDCYSLTRRPFYLLLSKWILVSCPHRIKSLKTSEWWAVRCEFIHQRMLDGPASSLYEYLKAHMRKMAQFFPEKSENNWEIFARYHLETGLIHHCYSEEKLAASSFKRAQEYSGFKWEFTGVLGKRAKFQTFEVTQLTVETQTNRMAKEGINQHPEELPLNDDQLLDKIHFTGKKEANNLHPMDQSILLAFCLNFKKSNPIDGLTIEEMQALISRSLENANNWLVHSMGLLQKSKLEGNKSRTVERSALQLQVLVDQYKEEGEEKGEGTRSERMQYFYSLLFPATWELEKELAEKFASFGAFKTALEIFERLQLWENVISCYQSLDKKKQAEEIIRREIEAHPTPKLYCLLGDVTDNIEHYNTAWTLSNFRFSRAQRQLGAYYYKSGQYEQAIGCFETALKINSLFHGIWFCLGCCYIQKEEYEKALGCFMRAVNLDPEDFESWNNISSIQIKLGKKVDAQRALKEAVKIHYSNWRVWENYLYVSLDIGDFNEAIQAFYRLLELKNKSIDVEALRILQNAVTGDYVDINGDPAAKHKGNFRKLMKEITEQITNDPEIWKIYASLEERAGNKEEVLEQLLKAYRSAQIHGWENDTEAFKIVANAAKDVVQAALDLNEKKHLYSIRLAIKNTLKKAQNSFEDTPLYQELSQSLSKLEKAENAL